MGNRLGTGVVTVVSALGGMVLIVPLGLFAAERAGVGRWVIALLVAGVGALAQAALVRWILPRLGVREGIPALVPLIVPATGAAALVATAALVGVAGVSVLLAVILALTGQILVSGWLLTARLGAIEVRIDGLGEDRSSPLTASDPGVGATSAPPPVLAPERAAPGAPASTPPAGPAPEAHAGLLGVEVMLADTLVAGLDAARDAGDALGGDDTAARVAARNHCAHQGEMWGGRLASVPGGPDTPRMQATLMVAALGQVGACRSEPEFLAALARLAEVGEQVLADPATVSFIARHRTPAD